MSSSRRGWALLLLALALALEAVLALGWVRPLWLWSHQVNPPDGAPMVTFLGRTRDGALRWLVPALALVALYLVALWVAARLRGRAATVVALVAPVVFSLTLLAIFPGGTQDIFHNVADGRLTWRYAENPTLVPPIVHPEDAFFPHLFGYVDLTSAYGPLWYLIDGLPTTLAGDGFVANVIAQKVTMAAFLLATVALVWDTVRYHETERGKREPERLATHPAGYDATQVDRPLVAAVLIGWNPLVLWETAGNGHNDIIMVFFAAAALALAVRGRWVWVFPALALSALVKFTTLLLGPVFLVWLLRRDDVPRRAIMVGLVAGALMIVVAYVPFWAGRDTLAFLRRPGMTFILSPATLLDAALRGSVDESVASRLTFALTGAAFAMAYLVVLLRIRGGSHALARGGFDGVFAYLLLASWWFWPWYTIWLAPLVGLARSRRANLVFVLFTCAALMTYCYWWSDPPDRSRTWFTWYSLITAGVFAAPLLLRLAPKIGAAQPSCARGEPARRSADGATSSAEPS